MWEIRMATTFIEEITSFFYNFFRMQKVRVNGIAAFTRATPVTSRTSPIGFMLWMFLLYTKASLHLHCMNKTKNERVTRV
jgi:hypothetical protein